MENIVPFCYTWYHFKEIWLIMLIENGFRIALRSPLHKFEFWFAIYKRTFIIIKQVKFE